MATCPSCGHELDGGAKFCPECGTPVAKAVPALRPARKVVTVLFSDVVGSTALGERLDPESLSLVMARYFGAMRTVVEAHGGTVEKFIGDAVMAVFGIPAVHEDDALRAARAASDMRDALAALNQDLRRAYGVALLTRTGINTGEVLTKHSTAEEGLVVGDAVNTAARLEQAAAPGEILLGALTYRLVRNAVVAERADPVAAKGKTEPVAAYRLLKIIAGAPGTARHLDSPLVGRVPELALLEAAYRRAVADKSCQLFTLLGPPGIGKSRLVAELADAVQGEATVLSGRCIPYGEGITFWPIGEIVARAAGISDDDPLKAAEAKLRTAMGAEDHAEVVVARVGELIGLAPATAGTEESFWALRTFLEALARRRPLVVVIDDIQWAEPTLLDLVEHVADWSRDVPLLLICPARPELLDVRGTWGGDRLNATSVRLEPLAEADATELLGNLLGQASVPEAVSARIAEAAQGNPLFVEEMFAMLVDDGLLARADGSWVATAAIDKVPVPPTIAALLAARLDRLSAEERAVLECASVVGQVFWRTSVAELAERALGPAVPDHLLALVRRELIRPDRSSFADDDAFRFRHLLVRDAAYLALPKAHRADLHEAFAAWLERIAGERVGEYEAILGYHLEQACLLRADLGPATEADLERARRGSAWLARAGRRSLDQGDDRSAAGLLGRAADLLPATDPERAELLVALGRALRGVGELAHAQAVLTEAAYAAAAAGKQCLHGRAQLESLFCGLGTGHWMAELEELTLAWMPVFTQSGDDRGLALAHHVLGWISANRGRHQDACRYYDLASLHARRVGDTRLALDCIGSLRIAITIGPTRASESLRVLRRYAEEAGSRLHHARLEEAEALVLAMQGAVTDGRALMASCRATYQELGLPLEDVASLLTVHFLEGAAGDVGAAAEELLAAAQTLETLGETVFLATLTGLLADALLAQGRNHEAERCSRRGEELADPDDVDAQVRWRRARARVLARRGELVLAEGLAREALRLVSGTDALNDHGNTLLDLAEVLRLAGRPEEAVAAVGQAIVLYEQKENLAMAAHARRQL